MDKSMLKPITTDQAKDAGMAAALICLLVAFFTEETLFYGLAALALLANMIRPRLFVPWARLWLTLSQGIGFVMSGIVLSLIFAVLVTPTGLFRKIIGKDPMQLKKWKQSQASVFRVRNHEYTSEDLRHPY